MIRRLFIGFVSAATVVALAQTSPKVLVAVAKAAMVDVKSPGTVECEGGQPGTDPQGPPCSPGTKRIRIWNRMSVTENMEVTGPAAALYRGKVNVVCHCIFDADLTGHCWGTYELSPPDTGGRWEGTWSSPMDLLAGTTYLTAVGYGTGGKLEGLEIRETAVGPGGTAPMTVVVRVTTK